MLQHLVSFFETKDPNALHHFRIQVKKMRALLLFLQSDAQEKYEGGHLVSLQTIFRHAGRIRNAHINLGLLEQYAVEDPTYKRELETMEQYETERFCAKRNAYIRTVKLIRKVLSKAFRDIEDKQVLILYHKKLRKLARFFSRPIIETAQWHSIRKKVKNLLYLYEIQPKSLVRKLKLNDAYLNQLQTALGKWHDIMLVLEFLHKEGHTKGRVVAAIDREKGRLYRAIQVLSEDFGKQVYK